MEFSCHISRHCKVDIRVMPKSSTKSEKHGYDTGLSCLGTWDEKCGMSGNKNKNMEPPN